MFLKELRRTFFIHYAKIIGQTIYFVNITNEPEFLMLIWLSIDWCY